MVVKIVLILHDVRSCHNVGSMLRTADGLGIDCVYLTGYTPYPKSINDARLPHIGKKIDRQIAKTSLGAEKTVHWEHSDDLYPVLKQLRQKGYLIIALEQTADFISLSSFHQPDKIALIVGNEVTGLDKNILKSADLCIEIPMKGKKESFNVAIAAAIALYHLKNSNINR